MRFPYLLRLPSILITARTVIHAHHHALFSFTPPHLFWPLISREQGLDTVLTLMWGWLTLLHRATRTYYQEGRSLSFPFPLFSHSQYFHPGVSIAPAGRGRCYDLLFLLMALPLVHKAEIVLRKQIKWDLSIWSFKWKRESSERNFNQLNESLKYER